MSRQKGSANLAASLEVQAEAPLDARTVVALKSDLTNALNFPYAYVGMPVFVKEESKLYILTEANVTSLSNWKEVGGGSGGSGGIEVVNALPTGSSIEDKLYHLKASSSFPTISVHLFDGDSTFFESIAENMFAEVAQQSDGKYTSSWDDAQYIDYSIGIIKFTYVGSEEPPLIRGKRAKYIVYWQRWDGSVTCDEYSFRYFEDGANPDTDTPYYIDQGPYDDVPSSAMPTTMYNMVFDTVNVSDLYVGDSQDEELTKMATEDDISELQSNFQAGVDSVYNALDAKGLTPSSKSLSDVVAKIDGLRTAVVDQNRSTGSTSHTFTNVKKYDLILVMHYQYNRNPAPSSVPSTLSLLNTFTYSSYTNALLYEANADISSLRLETSYATFALHFKIQK